jgi:hypothetical protein
MMDDLIAFLRAQLDARERELDEDYEVARLVLGVNAMADVINGEPAPRWVRPEGTSEIWDTKGIPIVKHTWARESDHIIRWDPARVLAKVATERAEVDAKRRILDEVGKERDQLERSGYRPTDVSPALARLHRVARFLALPYADKLGYQEDWRPR